MDNNQNNSNNNNNQGNRGDNNKKKPSTPLILFIVSIILTLLFWKAYSSFKSAGQETISYSEFLQMLADDNVKDVKIYKNEITFKPVKQEIGAVNDVSYIVVRTDDYRIVDRLEEAGVEFEEVDEGKNAILSSLLSYVFMIFAFYLLMMLIMRGATKNGGIMGGVGKSNAKMYVEKETGVTFADVAGQEEAKESLSEMVDFLAKPQRYLDIGAKLPRGALLVGPPEPVKPCLLRQ